MDYVSWALPCLSLLLFVWATVRWRGTLAWHSDYAARRDVALLLLLVVLGMVGDRVRTYFVAGSAAFLIISAFLILIGVGAIVFVVRLVRFYRSTRSDDSVTSGSRKDQRRMRE